MAGYVIVIAVLTFIAVLLFAPSVLKLSFSFNETKRELVIEYKFLFFKFTLYPLREKKENKKNKKKKKNDNEKTKKYTFNDAKNTAMSIKNLILHIKEDIIKILVYMTDKAVIIKDIDLKIIFDTDDPMQTGILTGTINGVSYNIISIIHNYLNLKKWNIYVLPLFKNQDYFDVGFNCIINIKNVHIISILFKLIKLALKLKKFKTTDK